MTLAHDVITEFDNSLGFIEMFCCYKFLPSSRTGKPRLHWVKENCKWVYKFVLEKEWPVDTSLESNCIAEIVKATMEDVF